MLILPPIVFVAIKLDKLALDIARQFVGTVPDYLIRRRVNSPSLIEAARSPNRFQNVRRDYWDACGVEDRCKRLGQVHHESVVVGSFGRDWLAVHQQSRSNAVRYLGIINNV